MNTTTQSTASEIYAKLTRRERDVANAIVADQTNKEIGLQLGIAEETVKEHMQHILKKTGCKSRVGVAVLVLRAEAEQEGAA